jgi:hypothetical protein
MDNILKPYYLCISSSLFSIPLIIYFLKNDKNLVKNILATFLFLSLLFSQLFWYNPICHSFIHKMDAIIAKLTAFLMITYTLFYINLPNVVLFLYLLLGVLTICAFYKSHFYSSKEWCCIEHLFNHSLIHIAAFFGTMYVFI